jgi:predicted acyltransferase (DUF342 family)
MAKNTKIQKTRSIIFIIFLFCSIAGSLLAEQGDTLNATQKSSDYVKVKNTVTEEISEQSFVKKFLHSLDEKKDFKFLLILIIIIFVIMLYLPFSPAIIELIQKKDDKPLFISMNYTKDPRFFDNSFREKLISNVDQMGVDRCFRVTLSGREELIEVVESKNIDNFKFGNHALYLNGDVHMKKDMKFSKEVYVYGTTEVQENTKIRALLSEKNLILGNDCKVLRWIGSEENIFVKSGCNLGVRCTCENELHLEENCVFKSLYGHPIITDYPVQNEEELEDIDSEMDIETDIEKILENTEEELVEESVEKTTEEIVKDDPEKPIYETMTFRKLEDDKSTISDNSLVMSRNELSLPQNTEFSKDLIVKSKLVIGSGSEIKGTIKCYDDITLKENVEVDGDIFSDKNIILGPNCRVWGNLFCQGEIIIASGCEIGTEGIVKSVIGKKGITLEKNVKIHGYVLTEGKGLTA